MTPHVDLRRYDTFVFEGCDGAGKTTLAAATTEALGATLIHSAPTPPGTDLVAAYTRLLDQPGKLVFDRCFLSELVYGPLYRGHSRLTYPQLTVLIRRFADRNGIFAHVIAPAAEIRRRLDARAEVTPAGIAEITDICQRYQDLFAAVRTLAPVIEISTRHLNETQ